MFTFVAVGLLAGTLVGIFVALWRAPEGYEDETGFHRGKQKKKSSEKKLRERSWVD